MGEPGRRQFGPYQVVSTLGEGSRAQVFLCQREGLERLLALKVLRSNLPPEQLQRSQRGAHLASKIEHPNVVRPLDIGQTPEGALYIAMEHVPGDDLRRRLERTGAFHWRQAADMIADAGEGVEAAHRAGVVHRDLEPSNLVLNGRTGRVQVLDFGLARDASAPSALSSSGEITGSPVYRAPELITSGEAGPPADVYSLAVILYELVSGEPPFLGRDLPELQRKIVDGKRLGLRERVAEVPRELEELLDRAMAKDPRRRPPAGVFAQSLRDLGSVATAIPTAMIHAQARGLPLKVGLSFALWVIVLGGVSGWALALKRERDALVRSADEQRVAREQQEKRQAALEAEATKARAEFERERFAQAEALRQGRAAASESDEALHNTRTELIKLRQQLATALAQPAPTVTPEAPRSGDPARAGGSGLQTLDANPEAARAFQALLTWACASLGEVPGAFELRAELLHDSGRYQEALEVLESAASAVPPSLDAQVLRARTLFKLRRGVEAQAAFAEVASAAPETPQGLFCRSLTTTNGAERLRLLEEALRKGPKLTYVGIMLGGTLLGEGARLRQREPMEAALRVLDEALALQPTSYQALETRSSARVALGMATRDKAQFEAALADLRRAYWINPRPEQRQEAARVFQALGLAEEALVEARGAVATADAQGDSLTRVQTRLDLAQLCLAQRRTDEAVRAFQAALRLDPALAPQLAPVLQRMPPELRKRVLEGLSEAERAALGG